MDVACRRTRFAAVREEHVLCASYRIDPSVDLRFRVRRFQPLRASAPWCAEYYLTSTRPGDSICGDVFLCNDQDLLLERYGERALEVIPDGGHNDAVAA